MSLRVLLADESSTIKKVIQLALQDYGVQVKAVPLGTDVEAVAKEFKPDIILADVLLAKKNGYEIAEEFSRHPELHTIPVILMWSGFITFDQNKFMQSKAKDKLEKPFEANALRQIVRQYVPKLQSNLISSHLTVKLPDFIEETLPPQNVALNDPLTSSASSLSSSPSSSHSSKETISSSLSTSSSSSSPLPPPPPHSFSSHSITFEKDTQEAPTLNLSSGSNLDPSSSDLRTKASFENIEQKPHLVSSIEKILNQSLESETTQPLNDEVNKKDLSQPSISKIENFTSLDEPDDFQQVPLSLKNISLKNTHTKTTAIGSHSSSSVNSETNSQSFSQKPPSLEVPDLNNIDVTDAVVTTMDQQEIPVVELESPSSFQIFQSHEQQPSTYVKPISGIDPLRVEEILQSQVRQIVTEIAWKVIPDLAERIIKEEIQKLLKEAEKLS